MSCSWWRHIDTTDNYCCIQWLRYFKRKRKTSPSDRVNYQINKAGLEYIFLIVDNSAIRIIFFKINIVQCRFVLNWKLIDIAN